MVDWDVVIVGGGMAGLSAAISILEARPQARLLILERGGELTGPTITDEVDFESTRERGLRPAWWEAGRLGGGFHLWYGQVSRFTPSDFEFPRNLPYEQGVPTWPITLDDLVPHYRRVEARLLPLGCDYGLGQAYDSVDLERFQVRLSPSHFERSVLDRLLGAGQRAHLGFTCLGGRAWAEANTSPTDPLAARRTLVSAFRSFVDARSNVSVLSGTAVERVSQARHATHVHYRRVRANGTISERGTSAHAVVLAAGALRTSLILMASDQVTSRELVGRWHTMTLERTGLLLSSIDRCEVDPDAAFGSVVVRSHYDDSQAPVLKGGKITLYDALHIDTVVKHKAVVEQTASNPSEFLRREKQHLSMKLSFKGESIASVNKRIGASRAVDRFGLARPAITYAPHPHDVALGRRVERYFSELAEQLEAELMIGPRLTGFAAVSAHHHGGAAMAMRPEDGVVGINGEVFGMRGTYVADGSCMPSCGGTNSSLTVMALADRVGQAVVLDHL